MDDPEQVALEDLKEYRENIQEVANPDDPLVFASENFYVYTFQISDGTLTVNYIYNKLWDFWKEFNYKNLRFDIQIGYLLLKSDKNGGVKYTFFKPGYNTSILNNPILITDESSFAKAGRQLERGYRNDWLSTVAKQQRDKSVIHNEILECISFLIKIIPDFKERKKRKKKKKNSEIAKESDSESDH